MKHHLIIANLAIALGLSLTLGCGEQNAATQTAQSPESKAPVVTGGQPKTDALVVKEGTQLVTVNVEGMHCNGCAWSIAEATMKLPGVADASANAQQGKAWVLIREDSETDPQMIVDRINGLADGELYNASAAP